MLLPPLLWRGEDLVQLAETARRLDYLYIPADCDGYDGLPSAIRVTDAVMEDVARHLPNLRELCLKMEGGSLTEASLISLGEHCKDLEECYISADIFFEELARKDRPGLFPVLDELLIIQPVSNRRGYRKIQQTAKSFLLAFPRLQGFHQDSVEPLSEIDKDFYFAAQDLILPRNVGLRGLV